MKIHPVPSRDSANSSIRGMEGLASHPSGVFCSLRGICCISALPFSAGSRQMIPSLSKVVL